MLTSWHGSDWTKVICHVFIVRAEACGSSVELPGTAAFNAAISSCALGRCWPLTLELLQRMPAVRVPMTRSTRNAALLRPQRRKLWYASSEKEDHPPKHSGPKLERLAAKLERLAAPWPAIPVAEQATRSHACASCVSRNPSGTAKNSDSLLCWLRNADITGRSSSNVQKGRRPQSVYDKGRLHSLRMPGLYGLRI